MVGLEKSQTKRNKIPTSRSVFIDKRNQIHLKGKVLNILLITHGKQQKPQIKLCGKGIHSGQEATYNINANLIENTLAMVTPRRPEKTFRRAKVIGSYVKAREKRKITHLRVFDSQKHIYTLAVTFM